MLLIYLATLISLVACDPLLFKPKTQANVLCPDKQGTCPDDSTCCVLTSGKYGCCPLKQATCCDDHIHCCPQGYTCNVGAGTCNAGNGVTIPLSKKGPASPVVEDGVVCPGGAQTCPTGSTCCKLSTGGFGCCPLPKATCCADMVHCCPEGYKCDTGAGTCSQGLTSFMWKDLKQSKVTPDNVICPDGASSCPTGSTCCQLLSGQYGCCPMVKAVCCSDHLHCCPSGTTCDVQTSSCLKSDGVTIPWLTKQPAKANENSAPEAPQQPEKSAVNDDIKCPDGTSTCPSDTTCCKLLSGYYGCCPYPNAICCSDHLHCCASTQTCDTEKGICKDGDLEVPWGIKLPAKGNTEENGVSKAAENIICPDKQGSCPSGSTCCKLTSGKYGCCPLEKATCCNDHIHCCPSGYSCDVAGGSCTPKSGLGEPVPWSMKTPTQPLEQIKCDASYSCPDGTTCCKMGSSWGCCPMPEAACCRDGAHCCPRGFHCSPSSQACFRLPNIAAMKSVELQEATSDIKDVKCEDQKSSCPDGTTCCKLATGQYGCCPYAKAICCNDHLHCCPSGYTCDTAQGTCKQSELSIPWAEKFPAKKAPTVAPIENNLGAVVCPDKKSQCQDGTTCCKLTTGVWGCCPLPEAVCCNDGQHCCPKVTKCNTAQGRCDSETNSLSISWDSIKRTEKMTIKSKATVKCQDSSECPQGSTCCQLASGKFGCCPLPNATCCADKVHCCPSGYTCDTKQATCTKAGSSLAMTWWSHAKTQATKPSSCCKNGGNNCCPSGSSCDEPTGQCVESIPWVEKVPALQKSIKTDAVMCADHVHECPEGSTCCKLVSGEWGCCPLPKAVCCKDGQHCCPSGYTCDTEHATCRSPKDIVSSFKLRP